MTITLVGMPGCGKSTVGRHLARHLGLRLVDSDHEIEKRIGMPIRSWFEAHGEAAFRDIEQQVIEQLCAPGNDIVLATGGGAVLRAANRERLRQASHVFYLRSTPEELFRRLRHDTHRPLLQVADPLRRLRELYRERDPLYRQVAHYVIETGRPSVPALVNMVLMQLELAGLVDPQRVPSPIDAARPAPPADPPPSPAFGPAVHSPAMTTSASSRALVVPVDTGHQRYDILIGSGLLDAAETWQGLPRAAMALIVSNATVAPLYAARLQRALAPHYARGVGARIARRRAVQGLAHAEPDLRPPARRRLRPPDGAVRAGRRRGRRHHRLGGGPATCAACPSCRCRPRCWRRWIRRSAARRPSTTRPART